MDEHNFPWKNDGRLKIMIGCGTRPEMIRLAAVMKRCREDFELDHAKGKIDSDILVSVVGERSE